MNANRQTGSKLISTNRPHVIVYERDGEWSRSLARFLPEAVAVVEQPSVAVTPLAEAHGAKVSLVVVDVPDDSQAVMAWAQQLDRSGSAGLHMAVMRPATHELAWVLRESGIAMVWDQYWQVPAMARMITRFWCRLPAPDLSVEQRIWNNLPWKSTEST